VAALLNAVGHDLRTPLAGIKAAVSSLRQPDIAWAPDDQAELLATVEESTDRLVALVENLLSLSRLQAGVLSADPRPVALDSVVAEAVLPTPDHSAVDVESPTTCRSRWPTQACSNASRETTTLGSWWGEHNAGNTGGPRSAGRDRRPLSCLVRITA
jgi:hypothetical protein